MSQAVPATEDTIEASDHHTDADGVTCARCGTPAWNVQGECWCIICAAPVDPERGGP